MTRKILNLDKRSTKRHMRGVVTLELALITAIVLVPFLFLVTELSRAMYQYNTLVKSVQDGAMYLAKYPASDTSHDAAAQNLVACGGPIGTTCTQTNSLVPKSNFTSANVTIARATVNNSKLVTVSITGFNYTFLMKNPLSSATNKAFNNINATMRQGS